MFDKSQEERGETAMSTETTSRSFEPRTNPRQIGHFRIKHVIAEGGMGTVYEAVQENPKRVVAVKVLKEAIASRSAQRRFEYEAQVLARLRHPCIAQIYEAGMHTVRAASADAVELSIPYFAMEYIPNAKSLTQYAAEKLLSTSQRLALFVDLCEAVSHGHQKGIIHRDLKPGNILVDFAGQVKLIDFGIARASEPDATLSTARTGVGQLIGTLQYMSPEQCSGDPHSLDTRSDVYSLGIVLYELLCEHLPYSLIDTPIHRAPQVICETPPIPITIWNKMLRGDVATIVQKALEKDPERRYQSAQDFADDVKRFLRSEPIKARPASAVYRFTKFVKRRPVPIALCVVVVAASMVAIDRQVNIQRSQALHQTRDIAYSVFMAAQPDETLKEPGRVIADCNRAIAMDPNLALAYALRAKAYTLSGNDLNAWRDCEKALALDPENAFVQRTLGYLHMVRGEIPESKRAYERGFQKFVIDTDLPRDFHNAARAYAILGEYPRALQLHDAAAALAPRTGRVYLARGLTRRMAGDFDGAMNDFETAKPLRDSFGTQVELWKWEMFKERNQSGDDTLAGAALQAAAEIADSPLEKELAAICAGNSDGRDALQVHHRAPLKCTIYYYLSIKALLEGRRDAARELLESALATKAHDLPEFDLARWHLATSLAR